MVWQYNPRHQSKHWCITINNPELDAFCLGFNDETDQYMICGTEHYDWTGMVQQELGTPHIQAYVQFKKRTTAAAVKSRWPRAHLEPMKGSPKQNVDYCSKEGTYHDHGECLKGQGSRSDLDDIKLIIDSGGRLADVRETHYGDYLRYQKAIIRDREFFIADRSWTTELHIRWGATGTGKSRYCAEQYPEAYWKTRGKWWDGYDGHETVVIDDFYGWLPFDELLRICDRYPLRLEFKGGFCKFVARKVIITSNVEPREWYRNIDKPELWAAFERRITSIEEFTSDSIKEESKTK